MYDQTERNLEDNVGCVGFEHALEAYDPVGPVLPLNILVPKWKCQVIKYVVCLLLVDQLKTERPEFI